MPLLVAGTLCIDTIETPGGRADHVLGGSGSYASTAAALFGHVQLVAPVGNDFPPEHLHFLAGRGIDLTGVQKVEGVRSQFWHGRYHDGLRDREHVAVDIDILDRWVPTVPEEFRDSTHVFLAHMPPHLQLAVLDQLPAPHFVLADTIDYWITTRRADVERVLRRVDALVVNDQEARLLTGQTDIQRMAKAIQRMGPRFAIIKEGEDGAYLDRDGEFFAVQASPADAVDTTRAGDTFAGALMAHLHATPHPHLSALLRSAVVGSVAASFTVEGFGLAGLARANRVVLDERVTRYWERVRQLTAPAGG